MNHTTVLCVLAAAACLLVSLLGVMRSLVLCQRGPCPAAAADAPLSATRSTAGANDARVGSAPLAAGGRGPLSPGPPDSAAGATPSGLVTTQRAGDTAATAVGAVDGAAAAGGVGGGGGDGDHTPEGDRSASSSSSSGASQEQDGDVLDIFAGATDAVLLQDDADSSRPATVMPESASMQQQRALLLVAAQVAKAAKAAVERTAAAKPAGGNAGGAIDLADGEDGAGAAGGGGGEEEEEDDMFAIENVPQAGAAAAAGRGPAQAAGAAALHDSYDDPEGYYNFQVWPVWGWSRDSVRVRAGGKCRMALCGEGKAGLRCAQM